MTSLYAMASELSALDEAVPDDEDAAVALKQWLESAQEEFEDKVDRMLRLAYHRRMFAKTRAEEAQRLAKLSKADMRRADSIEDAVRDALLALNRKRMTTLHFEATVCDNAAAPVVVDDETALPEQYRVAKTSMSIDKVSIAAALVRGEAVPGAHLGERGTHLRVR